MMDEDRMTHLSHLEYPYLIMIYHNMMIFYLPLNFGPVICIYTLYVLLDGEYLLSSLSLWDPLNLAIFRFTPENQEIYLFIW